MSRLYLLFLGLLLAELNDVTAAECAEGQIVSEEGICIDEDECVERERCGSNATCFNTQGSYYCQCVTGFWINKDKVNFTATDGACRDINECRELNNICGPNAQCSNSVGSYNCTCLPGFVASNGQKRFNGRQGVTCKDIDECFNLSICGPNANCINTEGSYYCTCRSGFVASNRQERFNASQNVRCKEIPKNPESTILCAPDAECHKTSVYCMEAESSTGQQQFQATVLVFLPLILWMFYQ